MAARIVSVIAVPLISPLDRAAMDAVATGAQDLAIGDPDGACILQMNEPASVGQGAPHSVECQV